MNTENNIGQTPFKEHSNYTSRYGVNEGVFLNFPNYGLIKGCKIHAIKFTESSLYYDIKIPYRFKSGDIDRFTIIENIENIFIIDEYKEIDTNE